MPISRGVTALSAVVLASGSVLLGAVAASAGDVSAPFCDLTDVTVDCPRAALSGQDLRAFDLTGAVLHHADLRGVVNHRGSMGMAVLHHADLRAAQMRRVDLRSANLRYANFADADLRGARLGPHPDANTTRGTRDEPVTHPTLPPVEMGAPCTSDCSVQSFPGADLTGANLSGADLSGADLSGANLTGVNLSGANLTGVSTSTTSVTSGFIDLATYDSIIWTGATCPNGQKGPYPCMP